MNFSFIASPLHALESVKKVFQWEGKETKSFDILKENINTDPVLGLLDLQQPFEIQNNPSSYAMGSILMQHKEPIWYHSETIIKYATYEKELYALVQSVKKWKHYLMGKETNMHTDQQPLQYLQSQTKLQ